MNKVSLLSSTVYCSPQTGFFCIVPFDELEDWLEEEHTHYEPIPDCELLKTYPEGKAIVKVKVKEYKRLLSNEADYEVQANGDEFKIEMCDYRREKWREQIKRLERMLAPFDSKQRGNKLAELKAVPIDTLLRFNSAGFTKCLYHPEKSPSAKYYPDKNHVYCFSCSKKYDSVDVKMFLSGLTLKELLR